MLPNFFQFSCSTKLVFQPGISRDFSAELSYFSVSSLFVITDDFLLKTGLIRPILDGIKNSGIEIKGIYSRVPPNSSLDAVKECVDEVKQLNPTALLAIGGGSVIDTAKAVNILWSHGGDLIQDYSGAETLPGSLKLLIVIPTTAGTGSEVTHAAVILDAKSHVKLSFMDQHLSPQLAILDPELTLALPEKLTAATGMDALTHAIESFTSIQASPVSRLFSQKAIELIRKYLLRAVIHGGDLEARGGMLLASTLAGIAFDHAMVGVVHAMAHAVGGLTGLHHGTANSIFLPWGMEYNIKKCEQDYSLISHMLGVYESGMDESESSLSAIEAIKRLKRELKQASDLPETLCEAGISNALLPEIATLAVEDGTSFYNPREVEYETLLEMIKKAYK